MSENLKSKLFCLNFTKKNEWKYSVIVASVELGKFSASFFGSSKSKVICFWDFSSFNCKKKRENKSLNNCLESNMNDEDGFYELNSNLF